MYLFVAIITPKLSINVEFRSSDLRKHLFFNQWKYFESQVVYVLLYVFKRVRKGQLNDIFDKFLHKCMCGSEYPVLEKYSITELRESDPWLWHIIFVIRFLSPSPKSLVSLVSMLLLFEPPWISLVTININNYIYVVVWNVLLISSSYFENVIISYTIAQLI